MNRKFLYWFGFAICLIGEISSAWVYARGWQILWIWLISIPCCILSTFALLLISLCPPLRKRLDRLAFEAIWTYAY